MKYSIFKSRYLKIFVMFYIAISITYQCAFLGNRDITIDFYERVVTLEQSQDFLLRATILYAKNSVSEGKLQDDVYLIYDDLCRHKLIKYIMYVNALNLAHEDYLPEINIVSTKTQEYKILTFIDDYYKNMGGFADPNYSMVWTKYDGELHDSTYWLRDILAHEFTHMAYDYVYDNDAYPYPSKKSKQYRAYKKICRTSLLKDNPQYMLTKARFNEIYDMKQDFHAEMIAYYIGGVAYLDGWKPNMIDEEFPGFKKFFIKYTIPDFKKYIEAHPNCKKIIFGDKSIQCKVVGA